MNITQNQNIYNRLDRASLKSPSFKANLEVTSEARKLLEKEMEEAKFCRVEDKDKIPDLINTIVKYFAPITEYYLDGTVLLAAEKDKDKEHVKVKYQSPDGTVYDTGFNLTSDNFLIPENANSKRYYIDLEGINPVRGIIKLLFCLCDSENDELYNKLGDDRLGEVDGLREDLFAYSLGYNAERSKEPLMEYLNKAVANRLNIPVSNKYIEPEKEIVFNLKETIEKVKNIDPDLSEEDKKKILFDLFG